jgi:hypothetical protein
LYHPSFSFDLCGQKKGPDDTKVKRKEQMIQRSKEKDGWYKGQKKRTDDAKAK